MFMRLPVTLSASRTVFRPRFIYIIIFTAYAAANKVIMA
jgi:hypothetical protein